MANAHLLSEEDLANLFSAVSSETTKRGCLLLAGSLALGCGGLAAVLSASGLSLHSVRRGRDMLLHREVCFEAEPPSAPEPNSAWIFRGRSIRDRYPSLAAQGS